MSPLRVAVFLGSRWSELEHQATRWREVLVRWRAMHPDLQLSVVDWPAFAPRTMLPGGGDLVTIGDSWLDGVQLATARVPLPRRSTGFDWAGWRWIGRALGRALAPIDAAISANPLWNPVLAHLGAERTGFDAVDDWRGHPLARTIGGRIQRGYRSAQVVSAVTANSTVLRARLGDDFGLRATTVPNGVDLAALQGGAGAPPGLPLGPFAVYVGVVQERVDVEMLRAAASLTAVPIVVAGPCDPAIAAELSAAGVLLLGRIEHQRVPGLLRAAAVGLIPHKVNAFTASMDPMKLLEYLAAGLRVVASPLPGIDALSDRVTVAGTPQEFAAAVERVARERRPAGPDPAIASRTWEDTASKLWSIHVSRPRR